jgi:alkylation response protein AidB-like acyl-CoA dehydrogenase
MEQKNMSPYQELLGQDLLDIRDDHLVFPDPAQVRLCYQRARMICRQSGMTLDDIVELRPKFWDFHRHLIATRDTAATTILTIHWNLCIGTIGRYARHRKDLTPLLDQLLNFDVCGEFLLTEIGHGLDARNLETTATLLPDGSYDLHTPSKAAAKAMPPNTPWAGIPRVAVVFARLFAHGSDCGVKPFIVRLGDASQLCAGVISRPLPKRSGAKAVDHAITTFHHVRLEPGSLLGTPRPAPGHRVDFLDQIWRVSIGTLSLSLVNIPILQQSAYIAGSYSLRRCVGTSIGDQRTPIISFATQYRPILNALVQGLVFEAFSDDAITLFRDDKLSPAVRHAVATCFKATVSIATQKSLTELADRCGWQGLFAYNRIIEMAMSLKGNSIAEGDYIVLCIRLVSEVLLGRYKLPEAKIKDSRLAKHEAGVWNEVREMIGSLDLGSHRDQTFNMHVLPRCQALVEATGHRMAYEAAFSSYKITPEALALFESSCIMSDPSWYCESESASRNELFARDVQITTEALPQLQILLNQTNAAPWTTVPILTDERWDEFVQGLPAFSTPDVAPATRTSKLT